MGSSSCEDLGRMARVSLFQRTVDATLTFRHPSSEEMVHMGLASAYPRTLEDPPSSLVFNAQAADVFLPSGAFRKRSMAGSQEEAFAPLGASDSAGGDCECGGRSDALGGESGCGGPECGETCPNGECTCEEPSAADLLRLISSWRSRGDGALAPAPFKPVETELSRWIAAARDVVELTSSGDMVVLFTTPAGTLQAMSADALLRMLEPGRSDGRRARSRRALESEAYPEESTDSTLDPLPLYSFPSPDEEGEAVSAGGLVAGLLALLATLGLGYLWILEPGCQNQATEDCELYCQRTQGRGQGATCLFPNSDCTCGSCRCPCVLGDPGSDECPGGGGPIVTT